MFNRSTLDTCDGDQIAASELFDLCAARAGGYVDSGYESIVLADRRVVVVYIRDIGTYREVHGLR